MGMRDPSKATILAQERQQYGFKKKAMIRNQEKQRYGRGDNTDQRKATIRSLKTTIWGPGKLTRRGQEIDGMGPGKATIQGEEK